MTSQPKRIKAAQLVATHWRDAAMKQREEIEIPYHLMAHPLSLVLEALEGELDPVRLGVEEDSETARQLYKLMSS